MAVVLFLLECDTWMCSKCHAKIVERFMPFDIPIHQAVHCEWKPEHGWAVCVGCGFFQGELPEGESAHPLPSIERQYALLSPQAKAIYDFYRDIGDWQSVAVIESDLWLLEIPEDLPDHIANIKKQFGVDVTIPTQTTEKENKVEKNNPTRMQEILQKAQECRESIVAPNVPCHTCNGSGLYVKGPIENGRPAGTWSCYCCGGKGYQTPEDVIRDDRYHNAAAARAIAADIRQAEKKEVKNMENNSEKLIFVLTAHPAENGIIQPLKVRQLKEERLHRPYSELIKDLTQAGLITPEVKFVWVIRGEKPIRLIVRKGHSTWQQWTKRPLPATITVGS